MEKVGQFDAVHFAKRGQLDDVDATLAGLAFRHERGVGAELLGDLALGQAGGFAGLAKLVQKLFVIASMLGFLHGRPPQLVFSCRSVGPPPMISQDGEFPKMGKSGSRINCQPQGAVQVAS